MTIEIPWSVGMKFKALFLVLSCSWGFQACKTASKRNASGNQTQSDSQVSGVFDSNNKMILPVPLGLVTPTTSSSQAPTKASVSGLGLAAPVASAGGESIATVCYSITTQFPNKNWMFYNAIYQGTTLIKEASTPIENCGDIQISLVNLNKTQKYKVTASIYYTGPKGDIIWYQGQTALFTPGDRDISLALTKLLQDQNIDVTLEKSPKEECKNQGYFWSGYDCLSKARSVVFQATSTQDMSSSKTANYGKCLNFGEGSSVTLQNCNFDPQHQLITMKFYQKGVQSDPSASSQPVEWYYILVGQEFTGGAANTTCVTVNGQKISKAPCRFGSDGSVDTSQLFTLTPATANDHAGLNAFRIASTYKFTQPYCISLQSRDNSGLMIQNNAPIALAACQSSNTSGQFVRFVDSTDFKGGN